MDIYLLLKNNLDNFILCQYIATFGNVKSSKCSDDYFHCYTRDYSTDKKYNFDKHLTTLKHIKSINGNDFIVKSQLLQEQ